MTREEKISRLKDILSEINESENAVCYLTSEDNELIESAIEALEQQPIIDVSNVTHKIAEFFSNWDGDETAKMEISVNDMREIAFAYSKKARIERQLKEKALDYNPDEWCHDCSEYDHEKHCCPRYNKVIRSAVEEMKQEPCEDAISRTDVKKYLSAPDANGDRVIYESDLDLLPPVTPQPKTGHWIYLFNSKVNGLKVCECDACKKRAYGSTHFCPNCGAKMFEPQESEG